ncbi:DUF218 domain containing protein [Nitzschia inconspicua]|uniref:DUF218 domain containing protein n=1 Tax=Nitzschia inconspicua TaxID=303405 RepID=A0A9K3LFL2_9STRA|nr:DUF218 domain containing protein [Nitzschia inconspicua]KAG7359991.1 DUF218 domain containing protein [Nitzschia inconspicua]
MARLRRSRRTPPVAPPKFSLTSLTWLLVAFFVLIGFFFFMPSSMYSDPSNRLSKLQQRLYNSPQDVPDDLIQSLDAILVLGGGVPTSIDHPPVYVERRCDDAIRIFERRRQQVLPKKKNRSNQRELITITNNVSYSNDDHDLSVLCLSAGTAHVPQLMGHDGLPLWESTACAAYLAQNGGQFIPPSNIFVETTSYDTIGNAFFTRTAHTDINGWRRLLVITNEFHMDRTMAIFDWIFSSETTSTKKKNKKQTQQQHKDNAYQLYYLQSPNVGLSDEAIQARRDREAASAKTVREVLMPRYTTLGDVYRFLTQDHSLYTAHKLVARGRGIDTDAKSASEQVKKSYGGG